MPLNATLQTFLEDRLELKQVIPKTGIAISVVNRDGVIYQGTFGLRDRERQTPVTNKTLFSICSLTKAFSVLPFLILQEKKQWDLNASLPQTFPVIQFKDRELQEKVTTIDLLSHRSGLPSNDLLWILFSKTPKQAVDRFVSFNRVDSFRNSFNYCNLDYTYLDLAFQNQFGSPLTHSIEHNVLSNLGLVDTHFLTNPGATHHEIARPYTGLHSIPWMNTSCISAAGGLYTNIEDIGRWMQFHLNSPLQSKSKLGIMPTAMASVYQPQIATQQHPIFFQGFGWLKDHLGYALGWFTARWNNEKVLFHPGIGAGFTNSILLFPDSGFGISVLANTTLSLLSGQLTSLILKTQFNKNVDPNPEFAPSILIPETPIAVDIIKTDHLSTGRFTNPIYGTIELVKQNTQWSIQFNSYKLPINFVKHNEAIVMLPAFGIQLPVSISFSDASRLSIPLSMDPRVAPQIFTRI